VTPERSSIVAPFYLKRPSLSDAAIFTCVSNPRNVTLFHSLPSALTTYLSILRMISLYIQMRGRKKKELLYGTKTRSVQKYILRYILYRNLNLFHHWVKEWDCLGVGEGLTYTTNLTLNPWKLQKKDRKQKLINTTGRPKQNSYSPHYRY